ncbi:5'-3' exoribonuclease 2, partial [Massospora cicadina]
MGVPAFFMWLSNRYPKIISRVEEELPHDVNGITVQPDISAPNPNGFEVDSLYLDMNGIVHPCCHPEDKPAPETEEDMMLEIYSYLDRIICMIRPRKLLYLAIDGVAPRAKMNQQRSRRFRAGQESRFKKRVEEEEHARLAGKSLPRRWCPLPKASPSNFRVGRRARPGNQTRFDSNCITPERLNNNAGWKDLNVILSDASVPGEGEHKIMDYIRRMRNSPGHDPNTQHVLYGLDADLIMLSLATHEPRFKVLREEVNFRNSKGSGCSKCGIRGHHARDCRKTEAEVFAIRAASAQPSQKPFVFLHVDVLREYLEVELEVPRLNFPYCLENAIDDWIFLIFFVGNDFLPHLPFLEIREDAISKLIAMWKSSLTRWAALSRRTGRTRAQNEPHPPRQIAGPEPEPSDTQPGQKRKLTEDKPSAAKSRAVKRSKKDCNGLDPAHFRFHEDELEIYFGQPGYEERYYVSKFNAKPDDMEFRKKVAKSYIEGLTWVLRYYYQGCCSWGWFYPYHYPPFASDFLRVDNFEFEFELGAPLRPFEQLMGVLPVDSKQHLPEPLHFLMEDRESPIIDFYPLEFTLDLNGANKLWKALALLPFIELDRLLRAVELIYPKLTPDEHRRNSFGHDIIYIKNTNPFQAQVQPLYDGKPVTSPIAIDPVLSNGISGFISKDPDCKPHGINRSPYLARFPAGFVFPTSLKPGATPAPPKLHAGDKDTVRNGGTRNFGRHDYQRHEYYRGRENYEHKTYHDLVKDGFIVGGDAPANYQNFYPQGGHLQRAIRGKVNPLATKATVEGIPKATAEGIKPRAIAGAIKTKGIMVGIRTKAITVDIKIMASVVIQIRINPLAIKPKAKDMVGSKLVKGADTHPAVAINHGKVRVPTSLARRVPPSSLLPARVPLSLPIRGILQEAGV